MNTQLNICQTYLQKIASRLEYLNYDDCTMAERQIVKLLCEPPVNLLYIDEDTGDVKPVE